LTNILGSAPGRLLYLFPKDLPSFQPYLSDFAAAIIDQSSLEILRVVYHCILSRLGIGMDFAQRIVCKPTLHLCFLTCAVVQAAKEKPGDETAVAVDVPDGTYPNLADGGRVEVKFGRVTCHGQPIILECCGQAGREAEESQ